MWSESEIREIVERKAFWVNEKALKKKLIEEILEGESRYSVEELVKIADFFSNRRRYNYITEKYHLIKTEVSLKDFLKFLKNSKKVQEVLG